MSTSVSQRLASSADTELSDDTDDIAVAVPVYQRSKALKLLLESVPDYVSTVYVADNGPEDQRDRPVYQQTWPFDLSVLHLDHDVGIGACRNALVTTATEPFVWIGDCDMAFTQAGALRRLRAILADNPDLGGVSGWLHEDNVIRSGARDLQSSGRYLIKTASDPVVETDPYPFARFDFIPQAGLFRQGCFDSYVYDPAVRSTEHIDFFIGQREVDDWEFASTPSVLIHHHKDIDPEYRQRQRGQDHPDDEILQHKWGIKTTVAGSCSDWAQLRNRTLKEDAFDLFRRVTPGRVWIPVKHTLEAVLK